jgi:hypothetical protein
MKVLDIALVVFQSTNFFDKYIISQYNINNNRTRRRVQNKMKKRKMAVKGAIAKKILQEINSVSSEKSIIGAEKLKAIFEKYTINKK